ncbi:MAG: TorA maturation chaperone TorD [Natronomonas sp.]|jgi:TorA maturation chaperone TorD
MTDDHPVLEPTDRWRDLHVVLAAGLRHPDRQLHEEVESGGYARELAEIASDLAIEDDLAIDPPVVDDREITEDYVALFEAARTPYAPPAESPYKPWYGSRDGGLMGGPPASDMRDRYRAIEAEIPEAYPADHVALQLEYASVLLEAGNHEEYRTFVANHLDWLPAFERATDAAAAEAPFHRWVVTLTVTAFEIGRDRLGVPDPTAEDVERMADRIDVGAGAGQEPRN